ncbi:MAG: hypothetical protein AB2556_24260, partial [Candidatus Thiodiazotropha sp.]
SEKPKVELPMEEIHALVHLQVLYQTRPDLFLSYHECATLANEPYYSFVDAHDDEFLPEYDELCTLQYRSFLESGHIRGILETKNTKHGIVGSERLLVDNYSWLLPGIREVAEKVRESTYGCQCGLSHCPPGKRKCMLDRHCCATSGPQQCNSAEDQADSIFFAVLSAVLEE